MAFSMSGVSDGYSYNRFDLYEKKSKDCDCKPKEDCDCDEKKSKGKGARWQDSDGDGKWYEPGEDVAEGMMPLPKEKMARQADKAYGKEQQAVKAGDEAGVNKQMQRRIAMKDPAGRKNQLLNKEEDESYTAAYIEGYQGKHGQSDKEYADSRSDGGKMISGDSKMSGAEFTHGRRVKADNPGMQPDVGGKTKPKSQGKMDKGTRNDLMYRKANLKKEDYGYSEVYEARKEGESPQAYADRVTKKHSGGKSKTYDPMKDSSFDHDEAEKTRGQSGKVAEGYQRNPEKGEEKSPGRGEKTPMPPRGDKRREEFEKWYAKNVREDVDLSIFGDNEIEALIGLYEEPEQIDEIVGAALAGIGDAVGGAAKGVGNAVGGVAKGVGSAVKGVGKGVGKAASGVGSAAGGAVDGVKKTVSGVTEETTRYHSYTEAYASMYGERLGKN